MAVDQHHKAKDLAKQQKIEREKMECEKMEREKEREKMEREKREKEREKQEQASGSSGAGSGSWWNDDWENWGKWHEEPKWKPDATKERGKSRASRCRLPRTAASGNAPRGCASLPKCSTEAVALMPAPMQHASIKSTCKQTYTASYHKHTHAYTVASRIGPGR